MHGGRGADVLVYFNPLTTQQIGETRQSRRAAKEGKQAVFYIHPKVNLEVTFSA